MERLTDYAAPLGRVLIAALFLPAGLQKLADPAAAAGYVASGGLPGILVWGAIAVEVLGGLFLILGFQTRWTALVLALFTVVTALLYHLPGWMAGGEMAQMQMLNFWKNIAIAGGLLAFVSHGAGALALDNRRRAAAWA